MLDQNHYVGGKLAAVIISITICQAAYAKASLVHYALLNQRQLQGDVIRAHRALFDDYETDVHPMTARVRVEIGLHPDPVASSHSDDCERRTAQERG